MIECISVLVAHEEPYRAASGDDIEEEIVPGLSPLFPLLEEAKCRGVDCDAGRGIASGHNGRQLRECT